ncbi:threonylcarbamoyl-AMP synthase [Planctomycetales bacterium ZRK34]|nr:threonylcarbamoyl-AMP synthase [Planctomycetales bacterium ZRK34]
MTAATLPCEAPSKRDKAIGRAAELLRRGGVVVFPTETVYGVGASVLAPRGLERLRRIKQRPEHQPFSVHIGRVDDIERYVDLTTQPVLRRLARKTMPGPITWVVEVETEVIDQKLRAIGLAPSQRHRLYHENTIGLRCPDNPVAAELLSAVADPVVAASANPAGIDPPNSAERSAELLGDQVDLILDGGAARYARASTIVRTAGAQLEVLREGVYDQRYLEKLMQKWIVFVCSGNTCRSPMAEALARHELARQLNLQPDQLESAGFNITSAGAFAMAGSAMSPEAEVALKKLNVPAGKHRARELTPAMIHQADVILCMTETHRSAVIQTVPSAAGKTHLLDPAGIAIDDPIGAGLEVYVDCATRMQQHIRARLDELARD